jgi:uncharacterized protein (DUF58 family)
MTHGIESSLEELLALRNEAAHLKFSARKVSHSRLSGRYASHFRGRGMDYFESRPYIEGDDVRNIDWRVTARTGNLHSKIFVEERDRPVLIVVDFSPSMYFGTRNALKSVVAARLAALMAWYASGHGDRVGGLLFSPVNQPPAEIDIRPAAGRASVLQLLQALATATRHHTSAEGENRLINAMQHAARVARPGSLILLISDFSATRTPAEQTRFRQPLHRLATHSDVIGFCISDPFEHQLPEKRILPLSNGMERIKIAATDKRSRDRLRDDFAARTAWLQHEFGQLGQPVVPVYTTDRLVAAINRPIMALGKR